VCGLGEREEKKDRIIGRKSIYDASFVKYFYARIKMRREKL